MFLKPRVLKADMAGYCNAPKKIKSGRVVGLLVACRRCWRCRKRLINDKIGRICAEAQTSGETWFLTLTYADAAGVGSVLLMYRDIQNLLKRLRKAGHIVRYAVAGEYGDLKSRAHWHIILFCEEGAFDFIDDSSYRFDWQYWPFGHCTAKRFTPHSAKYLASYIIPHVNSDGERTAVLENHWATSLKPLLGHDFILGLAEQWARLGHSPPDYSYNVPGVTQGNIKAGGYKRKQDNRELRFVLQGAGRDLFVCEFIKAWSIFQPGRVMPYSHVIDRVLFGPRPEPKVMIDYRTGRQLVRPVI